MMFGRAKPLDFPAPEPPTTRTSAVLVGVQADAEVLRQQDVLGVRLLAIFLTDLPGIAPSGRAMFFPSAVVLLTGIKNADPGCVK